MNPIQLLQRALALFGPDGQNWVNHCPRGDGKECVMTAINRTYDPDEINLEKHDAARLALTHSIPKGYSTKHDVLTLTKFNDNPNTTFQDIKVLFETAIKSLEPI